MSGLLFSFVPAAEALSHNLIRASIHGAAFVLLIWIMCRLLPRIPASVKCTLWWLAALKLLVVLAWVEPVPLRVLPAVAEHSTPAILLLGGQSDTAVEPDSEKAAPAGDAWAPAAVALWAAIAALLSLTLTLRVRKTQKIVRRAAPASPEVGALAAELSALLGLRRPPAVRISEAVDTPLVTGYSRHVVLLPADRFDTLSNADRRMALCHELMHLRRRDPWLALIPALAERIFFFHPLAHFAAREYGLSREAACDAAVLRRLRAQPVDYGRLLLTMGVAREARHLSAAGAPHSYSTLKRRIMMLGDTTPTGRATRLAALTAILVAVSAVLPIRFVARPVQGPGAAPPAPSAAALVYAAAPNIVAPPAHASPAQLSSAASKSTRELVYVFFGDGTQRMMSGSETDTARAEQFGRQGERMVWFRHDGHEYIVRDPAALRDIESALQPINQCAGQQQETGARQAQIAMKQAAASMEQAQNRAQHADLVAQHAALLSDLEARQAKLAASGQDRSASAAQELEKVNLELQLATYRMSVASNLENAQTQRISATVDQLREQMEALRKDMDALNRRMKEVSATVETNLARLFERAIATGAAAKVR